VERIRWVSLASVLAAGLVAGHRAEAQEPLSRDVVFKLRVTPSDATSAVAGVLTARMTAVGYEGNRIAWNVTRIEVRLPGSQGQTDRVWVDAQPQATALGAWWVTHEDPANPVSEEFGDTPLLAGVAAATEEGWSGLEYRFEATTPEVQPEGAETKLTSASYSLSLVAVPEEPIVEGEEEPTEVGGADF